jgi:hypothetical protein
MQGLSLLHPVLHRLASRRFGLLDFILILLGAGLAYWLVPGVVEGPGF